MYNSKQAHRALKNRGHGYPCAGGSDRREPKETWVGEACSLPSSGAEDVGCACVDSPDCMFWCTHVSWQKKVKNVKHHDGKNG